MIMLLFAPKADPEVERQIKTLHGVNEICRILVEHELITEEVYKKASFKEKQYFVRAFYQSRSMQKIIRRNNKNESESDPEGA